MLHATSDDLCGLCRAYPASQRRIHPYGMRLCESCALGQCNGRIESHGITTSVASGYVRVGRRELAHHQIRVHIEGPDLGSFSFQRKTFAASVFSAFSKPVRVGDPLFDDNVLAFGEPREVLQTALGSDGLQSLLLELAEIAPVEVRANAVRFDFYRDREEALLMNEMRRNLALVFLHLAAARGR